MSNLLDEMESDVITPTIGDNSLKEMADLCAEQASLEESVTRRGNETTRRAVESESKSGS